VLFYASAFLGRISVPEAPRHPRGASAFQRDPGAEVLTGKMSAFITANADYLIMTALVLGIAAITAVVVLVVKFQRLRKPFSEMAGLYDSMGTESSLELLLKGVDENREFIRGHGEDLKVILRKLEGCFRGIGMVKYNAFEDIGGNQSYSICILSRERNGFMLTNLVGRNSTRGYAIEVTDGEPERELGVEETEALASALRSLEE
jgi:hypothetical protein